MNIDEWMRQAIGVPFVPHGRDFDGWDCYGLAVSAYHHVLGVELPDFKYPSVNDFSNIANIFTSEIAPAWQLSDGALMDVVCIFRRGLPIHAGLVVMGGRIMHVEHGIETCHEPKSRFRIEGYYVPTDCSTAPVQG